jgi:hypothetical protein
MSATELLNQIERLPEPERRWLIEKLLETAKPRIHPVDEEEWSKFSGSQLLAEYAPEDSVYDRD